MKNLENYGVQEMNAKEIREVDGGGIDPFSFVLGAIVGGLIYDGVKWLVKDGVPEMKNGYAGCKI